MSRGVHNTYDRSTNINRMQLRSRSKSRDGHSNTHDTREGSSQNAHLWRRQLFAEQCAKKSVRDDYVRLFSQLVAWKCLSFVFLHSHLKGLTGSLKYSNTNCNCKFLKSSLIINLRPNAGSRINFSKLCPKPKVVIWIRIRDYLQILQVI